MKIALIDLSHATRGVHTNTIPLASGLIARYLAHAVGTDMEIRIFKTPAKCLAELSRWTPDAAGIAQYAWNSELNLHAAGRIRERNPGCLIVAGGPNLPLSPEGKAEWLVRRRLVDLCVSYDGEQPFASSVKRLMEGATAEEIRSSPVPGTYALDPARGALVESPEPPPRLDSLDVFGAPYADGFFDSLLDEGYHPFVQTQRGCPFRCAYCHASDLYYSRLIFQSAELFGREIEYLGRRYAGRHEITLYMANTNFGLLEEDFKVARMIRRVQEEYDWPRNIFVSRVHDAARVLRLLPVFKYTLRPSISFQTLTPAVLRAIRRKNMPFEDFVAFQKKVPGEVADSTMTELILNLPGETRASFLESVSRVLDAGVQNVVILTLMALPGTPIASLETAERYGHRIMHRVVPRCFSEFDGRVVLDSEEVVVGTDSMPFEDYLDLRALALTIAAFASSAELYPVRKFLLERGAGISRWIFGIHERIRTSPGLNPVQAAFLGETRGELFPSREALVEHFSRKENYDLLLAGSVGDNLIRKYKTILLSEQYDRCLETALSELRRVTAADGDPERIEAMAHDLGLYVHSRNVSRIFTEGYGAMTRGEMALRYDIPEWIAAGRNGALLEAHEGPCAYSLEISDYMRKRLEDFMGMNRDPGLSIQILYRDGGIKDFWPLWVRRGHAPAAGGDA